MTTQLNKTRKVPWWRQLDRTKWKAFFAAWLGVVLDGYDYVLISFALADIIRTFDLTLVQGASLVSAAFISRWIGGLLLGAFGDRFGRRPAMIVSMGLFAIASVAMAFAPSYALLFLFRLIIGFAMAGEYSTSATYVIESWPKHMRNKASGFLLSGFAFGVILAAQVDKYLTPAVEAWHPGWGWRALFLTGVAPIFVALYMRRNLPEADEWKEAKRDKSSVREPDAFHVLFSGRRRILNILGAVAASVALMFIFATNLVPGWAVAVLAVILGAIFVTFIAQFDTKRWIIGVAIMITIFASFMYTWPIQGLLPTYLEGVGYDPGTVNNIVTFAGLGNAVGYIVAGFAGDAIGMRRWYVISLFMSQTLVFPLFMQGGEFVVLVSALLFFNQMFGQGVSGLLPKWVASYFPVERRAAGLGFCYNVGALGGAVGPFLGASLAASYGLGMALAVLSVGFALVVILSIRLNLPRRLQSLVNHHAVRPEDGNDEVVDKV